MAESDKNTLHAIKVGDVKAYEKLFRTFYAPLCGYVNKMVNDKEIAEEIVQDLFYKLWKNRATIEIKTSLKSYLYKSVYNKALHYFDHEKVKNKYAEYASHTLNYSITPDEAMETVEVYSLYKTTLNSLPTNTRKIFQMSRNYGLKYHEIADRLSISVKTVEANMGKALKAFRQSFANY